MADQNGESATRAGDLALFIEETLVQIVQGIVGAQLRVDSLGAQINPAGNLYNAKREDAPRLNVGSDRQAYLEVVEFDVAVTRMEEDKRDVSGGIAVLGIGAGGGREAADTMTRVSRLRFKVPVVFPGDHNLQAETEAKERKAKAEALKQSHTRPKNWVRNY